MYEKLIEDLMNLPQQIKDVEISTLDINEKLTSIKKELDTIESSMMSSILNETDEKGKPVFSNAEKRNTELERRMSAFDESIEMKKNIDRLERQYKESVIEIRYLRDLQSNYKAIMSYTSNSRNPEALNS